MKRILIVDDEMIILDMLTEFFEFKGYQVISASTEAEAKLSFEANKNDINVVILDMLLKHTTSEDLFFYMKQLKPELKIMISSGLSLDEFDEDLKKLTWQFVKKPYVIDDLVNLVDQAYH